MAAACWRAPTCLRRRPHRGARTDRNGACGSRDDRSPRSPQGGDQPRTDGATGGEGPVEERPHQRIRAARRPSRPARRRAPQAPPRRRADRPRGRRPVHAAAQTAGLRDDQGGRRHVPDGRPRLHGHVEVALGDQQRRVQRPLRRLGTGPRTTRQVAVRVELERGRGDDADPREPWARRGRGDGQGSSTGHGAGCVQRAGRGAAPAHGPPDPSLCRDRGHGHLEHLVDLQREQHQPAVVTADEVRRPVDRVDDPPSARPVRPVAERELLAQDGVPRGGGGPARRGPPARPAGPPR